MIGDIYEVVINEKTNVEENGTTNLINEPKRKFKKNDIIKLIDDFNTLSISNNILKNKILNNKSKENEKNTIENKLEETNKYLDFLNECTEESKKHLSSTELKGKIFPLKELA